MHVATSVLKKIPSNVVTSFEAAYLIYRYFNIISRQIHRRRKEEGQGAMIISY